MHMAYLYLSLNSQRQKIPGGWKGFSIRCSIPCLYSTNIWGWNCLHRDLILGLESALVVVTFPFLSSLYRQRIFNCQAREFISTWSWNHLLQQVFRFFLDKKETRIRVTSDEKIGATKAHPLGLRNVNWESKACECECTLYKSSATIIDMRSLYITPLSTTFRPLTHEQQNYILESKNL